MSDTSRDPADLHPLLRERWAWMAEEWGKLYPGGHKPFLTATFRGPIDQGIALRNGSSKAPFGFSLHNFKPAYAFDVAFLGTDGKADWSFPLFERMGFIGEKTGLEWGGRWPNLVDGPHFQLPMTISMAKEGRVPEMPELLGRDTRRKIVLMREGRMLNVVDMEEDDDVVVRYSQSRRRVYVDVRKEGS